MKQPFQLTKGTLFRFALQGIVLGILAGTVVFFFTVQSDTLVHFRQFRWSVGLILFPLIFIAWLCNGCRILVLSRSLGYPLRYTQSLAISLSSEFGIAATPAGMGGAAIRLALLRRAGVPLAHGTSMLATDVALDTLFFALLFPFALLSLLRNKKLMALFQKNHSGELLETVLILIGTLMLIIFVFRTRRVKRWIRRGLQASPLSRFRLTGRIRFFKWRLVVGFRQMREGLKILFGMRRGAVLLNFILSSIQWTCRYSILPIVLYALSIKNDPVLLFMLQGLLFTASLVFVLPGGGGGVEVTTALILPLIIPRSLVGIVILLWRFFTYHLYLLGGGAAFFTTCARLNSLFPKPAPREEEEGIMFNENNGNSKSENDF